MVEAPPSLTVGQAALSVEVPPSLEAVCGFSLGIAEQAQHGMTCQGTVIANLDCWPDAIWSHLGVWCPSQSISRKD